MNYRMNAYSRLAFFLIISIIIFAVAEPAPAAPQNGRQMQPGMLPPGMGGPAGHMNRNLGGGQLDQMLSEVLQTVNQGGDLTREKQIEMRQLLQQEKQSRQTAEYQLLEAWSSFYSGDIKGAYRAAMMANRIDAANPDAQASMLAMAILSGSTEYVRNAMAKVDTGATGSGMLELDASAIGASMLGQKIGPIGAVCMNSTKFVYPGKGNLCMVLWQLEEKVQPASPGSAQPGANEPNSVGSAGADSKRQQQQPAGRPGHGPAPGMLPPGMNGGNGHGYAGGFGRNQQPTGFDGEMTAFGQLFMRFAGNSSVSFLGVNTDSLANSSKVAAKLLSNPWPWAQVMAEMPTSGLSQYAAVSVDPEKPTLVVTDERGQVKYAGPVSGFLPKMVMQSMQVQPLAFGAGVSTSEIDPAVAAQLAQQMQSQQPGQQNQSDNLFGKMMGAFSGQQQPDPQQSQQNQAQPQAGGQMQQNPAQPQKQNPAQPQKLTIAQEYDAGKLLRQAQAQLGGTSAGSVLRMSRKRSERGIKFCREILQKYPNTEFADEARNLLRKVPDRYKEEFNVTDEEIGR